MKINSKAVALEDMLVGNINQHIVRMRLQGHEAEESSKAAWRLLEEAKRRVEEVVLGS